MGGMDDGGTSAIVASGIVTFDLLTGGRVRPYVLGGLGVMRTRTRDATGPLHRSMANATDVGWGPVAGVGARVCVTPHVSLRLEATHINALWQPRGNLGATRLSLAVGYQW